MQNTKSRTDKDKELCVNVVKLQEIVADHAEKLKDQEERLKATEKTQSDNASQFAVINYKLNMVMAILGAIGVALLGVIINIIFK